ncbi:MAG: hypothetical protein ABIR15_08250 [Chitinophagaceae bacterium]
MLAFSGAVLQKVWGQGARYVIAEMRVGKIRGIESRGIKIFKEILYGANTERGGQQVYATIGPGAVDGGRDALAYVHSAPQTAPASGSPRAIGNTAHVAPKENFSALVLQTPAIRYA